MFYYRAFGLTFASDLPITELPACAIGQNPDVIVNWIGDRPCPAQPQGDPILEQEIHGGIISVRAWKSGNEDSLVRYQAPGLRLQFWITNAATRVVVSWSGIETTSQLMPPFTGTVMGLLLRARGRHCLHASAVQLGTAAVLFLGQKGAGKSTLAAALLGESARLISDDISALGLSEGRYTVYPGTTSLRLWRDSAFAVEGLRALMLPKLFGRGPYRPNKRLKRLPEEALVPAEAKLSVSAICVLEKRRVTVGQPTIIPISRSLALASLAQHTYAAYASSATERSSEFAFLARLAESVPIFRLSRPDDLRQLPQTVRLIHTRMADLANPQPRLEAGA